MDRLPTLILITVLLGCGCDQRSRRSVNANRVDAVAANKGKTPDPEAFCDVFNSPATAPPLRLPELTAATPAPAPQWGWLNVWATWCKPCIEELPTLRRWQQRLGKAGTPVSLTFVSVDETQQEIDDFKRRHPDMPKTLRIKRADDLEQWVSDIGLDSNAAIPIHIFARAGKNRCVRTGALEPHHYDVIAAIVSR